MSRTRPSPAAVAERGALAAAPRAWFGLFLIAAVVVGAGMAALVLQHLADLRGGSPLVADLLAIPPTGAGPGTPGEQAIDSGSRLLGFAALATASAAAAMLLLGAGLAFSASRRRTGHRLMTLGLWLALVVCLAAMLPVEGLPFAEQVAAPRGPRSFEWNPALKAMAVAAGAGLLLSRITAQPHPTD